MGDDLESDERRLMEMRDLESDERRLIEMRYHPAVAHDAAAWAWDGTEPHLPPPVEVARSLT